MRLDYIDPECTEEESMLYAVSSFVARQAYNDLCKMIGGNYPDARIQEEAPKAHEFFMQLFGVETKKVS